jgi:hypothetical protein
MSARFHAKLDVVPGVSMCAETRTRNEQKRDDVNVVIDGRAKTP